MDLLEDKLKRTKLRGLSLRMTGNRALSMDMQGALDKRLEKLGKNQTIPVSEFMVASTENRVPLMVRRCVARVFEKMKGSRVERMNSAIQICTWVFRTYGYTKKSGKTSAFKMTAKGKNRNKWHKGRNDTPQRDERFRTLMNKVFNPLKASKKNLKIVKQQQVDRKKELDRRYNLARSILRDLEKEFEKDNKQVAKIGTTVAKTNKLAMDKTARKRLKSQEKTPKKLDIGVVKKTKTKRKNK